MWWLTAAAVGYLAGAITFYVTLVATAEPEPEQRNNELLVSRNTWRKAA